MSTKQNIHLFFGEDSFQMQEKLKIWKDQFKKKYEGDLNLITLDTKDITANEIIEAVDTIPFLAEKKLVIVMNFLKKDKESELKKLATYIEKELPDHAVLVFQEEEVPDKRKSLYKKLCKIGNVHEFKNMEVHEITEWIIKRANGQIKRQTASFFVNHAGTELWKIEKELMKLMDYSDGKEISIEDIKTLVMPSLSSSIFKLTDAIAQKEIKEAFAILQILLDSGEDPYKVFFMIVRHFRILIQVKDLSDKKYTQNEITKSLKQHPFAIMTAMKQANKLSIKELKVIYKALLKFDIGIKNGLIRISTNDKKDFSLNMEKLLLEFCN